MIEVQELRKQSNLGLDGWKIVAKNELMAFFQSKGLLATQLLQPILYIVFIVVGLNSSIRDVSYNNMIVSYAHYTTLGIIGLLVINQMTQVIYRVTIDKKYGLLALKLCSGVKPFYYIIGMSVYPMLGLLIQELTIYLIAMFFGIYFSIGKFLLIIFLSFLLLLFWNTIGILITMFINDYRRRDIVIRFLLTPLGFTAPVFYVMEAAPTVVQWFGRLNPLTYQIDTLRTLYFGGDFLLGAFWIGVTTFLALSLTVFIIPRIKLVLIER